MGDGGRRIGGVFGTISFVAIGLYQGDQRYILPAGYSYLVVGPEPSNVKMQHWASMYTFSRPACLATLFVAHAGLRRGLAGRPPRSPAASAQSQTVLRCRFEPRSRPWTRSWRLQGQGQRWRHGRRRRRPRRPCVLDAYASGGERGGGQVWVCLTCSTRKCSGGYPRLLPSIHVRNKYALQRRSCLRPVAPRPSKFIHARTACDDISACFIRTCMLRIGRVHPNRHPTDS